MILVIEGQVDLTEIHINFLFCPLILSIYQKRGGRHIEADYQPTSGLRIQQPVVHLMDEAITSSLITCNGDKELSKDDCRG